MRRSHAVALEGAPWLRIDLAPLCDESLPGKCTTFFICSGLGRFLNGAASHAGKSPGFFLASAVVADRPYAVALLVCATP